MKKLIKILILNLFLFCSQSPIVAKTIYFIPPLGFEKKPEKFLDPTNPCNLWGDIGIAFGALITACKTLGYSFTFTNTNTLPIALSKDDFLIFAGIKHFHMFHLKADDDKDALYNTTIDLIKKYPQQQLSLIALEPEINDQYNYLPQTHNFFGSVFTCYDSLKGPIYHKYCYPKASLKQLTPLVPFAQRKLCTMIAGKKKAIFPNKNDLYAQRKKIITFFEKNAPQDFEFYGLGWKPTMHICYKGRVPAALYNPTPTIISSQVEIDKIETLKKYRFCICFENMKKTPGYITEKIFDCFKAGCVPVYWGANNIHEYIPKSCYIDREKYQTLTDLYEFLRNMPKKVFNEYQENITKYLNSKEAYLFSVENFVDSILQPLIPDYQRSKIFTENECKKLEKLTFIKQKLNW